MSGKQTRFADEPASADSSPTKSPLLRSSSAQDSITVPMKATESFQFRAKMMKSAVHTGTRHREVAVTPGREQLKKSMNPAGKVGGKSTVGRSYAKWGKGEKCEPRKVKEPGCLARTVERICCCGSKGPPTSSNNKMENNYKIPVRVGWDPAESYDVKEELGSGAYGVVKRVFRKRSGKERVMKIMEKDKIPELGLFDDEIRIQMDMDHPNIVRIFDYFDNEKEISIVMEICSGGDVGDALGESFFIESDAHAVMSQVIKAVCYMHSVNIAHRDLKPENFLLQEPHPHPDRPLNKNVIKVVDFGFAKEFETGEKMMTMCGTPHYMAPELLRGNGYCEKADIWSCGVILYVFLSGVPPFGAEAEDIDELVDMVKNAKQLNFDDEPWKHTSPEVKLLLAQMCQPRPDRRHSAQAVSTSRWIANQENLLHIQCSPKMNLGDVSQEMIQKLRKFKKLSKIGKKTVQLVARSIDSHDVEKLRQMFTQIDANGDGKITLDEVQNCVTCDALCGAEELKALFSEADDDNSGSIDYTEFLSIMTDRQTLTDRQAIWEAFRVIDKDGTRSLDKNEITGLLMANSEAEVDPEEIEEIMKTADKDGDGSVDFDEFYNLVRGAMRRSSMASNAPANPSPSCAASPAGPSP